MLNINLSQSALSKANCMLNLKRTVIDGYKELPSSNIVYGEAVHKFRHIMFQSKGHIPSARKFALEVFNQPKIDKPKSPHLSDANHMLTTAFNFWEMYVVEDKELELLEIMQDCWKCGGEGVLKRDLEIVQCDWCKGAKQLLGPATEISFSIPYYKDDFISVDLCGTLDGLGKIKGGCYVIPDLKTTSSWDTKGYFGTYAMSKQLRLYVLALKIMAERFPDSILGQVGKTKVGAFIDAIFVKPAPNENKYGRSDVFPFPDWDIAAFKRTLDNKILELSAAVRDNYYPKEGILNGTCEGKWGRCPFWFVCQRDNNVAQIMLDRDFKKVPFNPLNYSGV
jgi:hypothetical protein